MFEDIKPHLQDLRKRLLICVVCIFIAFAVCFGFWESIFEWIASPIHKALQNGAINAHLATLSVLEGVFVALKVALFSAIVICAPITFWQFWLFIAPGLYKHEKMLVLPFVGFASIMFLGGVAFSYYFVLPLVVENVLLFGTQMFEGTISADDYMMFFMRLLLGFGLGFELPVVSFFLAKVGLISDLSLKKFFKYAVVIIFIVAAFITPPDVVSQILLAIPLIGLYGFSIFLARLVNHEEEELEKDDEEIESSADSKNTSKKRVNKRADSKKTRKA